MHPSALTLSRAVLQVNKADKTNKAEKVDKVVERVLLHVLGPYCQNSNAFGDSQFAFQKGLSCNDLVTALVCSWLLDIENREKVGVYLNDISGVLTGLKQHAY